MVVYLGMLLPFHHSFAVLRVMTTGTQLEYKFLVNGKWTLVADAPLSGSNNNVATVGRPARVRFCWRGDAVGDRAWVVGSFSAWTPVAMTQTESGFTCELTLDPGPHVYKFWLGESRWECDVNAPHQVGEGSARNSQVVVSPYAAGLGNPDSRCFLNSCIQLLHAVAQFRCALLALRLSQSTLLASIPMLGALSEVVEKVHSRVGPATSHELHHQCIEEGLLTADVPDDPSPLVMHFLGQLSEAFTGLKQRCPRLQVASQVQCPACGFARASPRVSGQPPYLPLAVGGAAKASLSLLWSAAWQPSRVDVPCPVCEASSPPTAGQAAQCLQLHSVPVAPAPDIQLLRLAASSSQLQWCREHLSFSEVLFAFRGRARHLTSSSRVSLVSLLRPLACGAAICRVH